MIKKTLKYLTVSFCFTIALGCSDTQQDTILDKLVSYGRDNANLVLNTEMVDHIEIHYLERPAQTNASEHAPIETVVLLHGFSANKDNWLEFSQQIDPKFRLLIPDWPGHGNNSPDMNTDYNLFKQAGRLHQLLAQVGTGKVHLIGNSMGGGIAMIYRLLYPHDVSSLALMNTLGFKSSEKSEYFQALENGTNPLIACDIRDFDKLLDLTMHKPPYIPSPVKAALARQSVDRCEINRKIFADMLASRETLAAFDFETGLAKTALLAPKPVLVIWGDKDRVLDIAAVEDIKRLMPEAEVKIFTDIGHLPLLEVPGESGSSYNDFLLRSVSDADYRDYQAQHSHR
ncbi:Lipase 1 [BD1-7 clade bacterium]|uniref:Lipase 1 n=1 Tax=BD1-7 clade bacterium TaxID=2029982 RepID=A0A5S9PI54_9GAMM|nr:Lipase 1 [BD1-7 clade bacterium]